MLASLIYELRQSLRMLWSRPGFSISVALTLALSIGINTAVFSAIEGQLLRPLPYPQSDRLVHIANSYPKSGVEESGNTVADYLDRRAQADTLKDSAIYYDYSFDLTGSSNPQRVVGVVASPSLFSTLRVNAQLGRTFSADEAIAGHEHVVVLSHSLWVANFSSDVAIVGKDVRISGQSYRVIGVMPARFSFPRPEVRLWVPFAFTEKQKSDAMRGFEFAQSIGRLKDGATIAQLNTQMDGVAKRTLDRLISNAAADESDFVRRAGNSGFTGRARSLHQQLAGNIQTTLWLMQAAAFLVLLIACANVANLMLIRASERKVEMGVRAALGASAARMARQLFAESLLLIAMGGTLGLGLAAICIKLLRWLQLDGASHGFAIDLNLSVLSFAIALMLAICLALAVAPIAFLRNARPSEALRTGSRGQLGSRSTRMTRNTLVVAQIALSVALLGNAALLVQSFLRTQQQSPGFDRSGLIGVNINLSRDRFRDPQQTIQFRERVIEAVRELPGVQSAGLIGGLPFSEDFDSSAYFVENHNGSSDSATAYLQTVGDNLFQTMRIPLLRGRDFTSHDDEQAPPVAIIDAELAHAAFGEQNPIGKRIATRSLKGLDWRTIVGVVASIKRNRLSDLIGNATLYLPNRQSTSRIFRIAIRSDLDAAAIRGPLREAIARIDPEQPVWGVMSMDERIDQSLDERRTPMWLVILFACSALALTAVGIYGVLASAVSQRTSELGLRMSLGATHADILKLVIRNGMRLVLIGAVIGSALAIALARQIQSQLFEVKAADPLTLALVLATVAITGLLACWIPARRAGSTSPIEALRSE